MQKKLVILGAGESGTGAALLAKARGYDVFISDKGRIEETYKAKLTQAGIDFEEGKHTESIILQASEVIKSPGIPDKAEIVKKIHSLRIPIISEIELASRYTLAPIIAITGSNGKTTTTSLIHHILTKSGVKAGLGGNIGESFAAQVLEAKCDYWVLEISSFQLDDCHLFRPHIAVLTNITPDHLDRYMYDFQNYINAKFRIAQAQDNTDYFIAFTDNEPIISELVKRNLPARLLQLSLKKEVPLGAWLNEKEMHFVLPDESFSIPVDVLTISGKHNYLNAMAAVLCAKLAGVTAENCTQALRTFQAVEHRMEEAGTIHGITYINDSKATNVDSVYYALESMQKPVVLILGGVDKGNDYTQIEKLVREKVKTLVCMGLDNSPITTFFKGKVNQLIETSSLAEAMEAIQAHAQPGDVVLLSPACASFDLFKNYEDRGQQFKKYVSQLTGREAAAK